MKSSRRPTQYDVAKRAGVSAAVVSKVLNPDGGGTVRVGSDAEKRVLAAVSELGYVPNPVARNLAQGRTQLLGVFTFESIFPTQQRDFYFPFLVGIEHAAEASGFDLLLFTSASDADNGRSVYRDGVNRLQMADGAILLGRKPRRDELARLAQDAYPFVTIGRREIEGVELSYVAADYGGATADLTTLLIELEHRHIVYVGVEDPEESARDRETGYRAVMEQLGLGGAANVMRLAPHELDAARLDVAREGGATAFLIENDELARRLLAATEKRGLTVPRDLSFAVLGDPLDPQAGDPDWTMFQIPREEMGGTSFQVLLELLADPTGAPRRATVSCRFAPGWSTARAPSP